MIDSNSDLKNNNKRVAVAMSGGIDSSMSAKILKDEGWDLIGVTMKILPDDFNWKQASKTCCSVKDIETARKACLKLQIPHFVIDLLNPFEEKIINNFCFEYQQGRTPNPCIDCNKYIKFGSLLKRTKELGASFIATGHYCKVEKLPNTGLFGIKKGADDNKDQSYLFWRLDQEQLSQIKTPLGRLSKKSILKESNKIFPFLKKKSESQDICFIPGSDYNSFLRSRLKNIKKGNILDIESNIIGTHKGYPFYTIGQRKGLGISHSKPLYVKEIIPGKNLIVAGEDKDLKQKIVKIKDINFIAGRPPAKRFKAMVKIRYNSRESPAEVEIKSKDTANIKFLKPQIAVTPGQSAVFYNEDILIGGGIIIKL
jgi:tRNA-specific 2-thiouridylase